MDGSDDVAVDGARMAGEAAQRALGLIQAWLADERFVASRLVLVTRGAVAARGARMCRPGRCAGVGPGALGAVRASRVVLCWSTSTAKRVRWRALGAALATGEPQLAVREGAVSAPRLARLSAPDQVQPAGRDAEACRVGRARC